MTMRSQLFEKLDVELYYVFITSSLYCMVNGLTKFSMLEEIDAEIFKRYGVKRQHQFLF